ncbi:unnamed protein product [Effrenium voratum]|nr:unnamed protein product [Effrenium voratum]CAJ1417086.1 unnamed protein product [Effrenium voratum]
MPQRKSSASSSNGVSPQQFCWACICFLGTVLAVQVCVLVCLLRRLSEVQHLGQATPEGPPSARQDLPITPSRPAAQHLAVAAALGAGPDELQIFVSTFQRAAPDAQLVVLVEDIPTLEANLDMEHLTFERVDALPPAWSELPAGDARLYHFNRYLQGVQAELVQLSDVEGIAFQASPFVWASGQDPGLQLFYDESGYVVGSDARIWNVMRQCYGTEAETMRSKTFIPPGYMIGSTADIQRYVSSVVREIDSHPNCQKRGVAAAVSNWVAHTMQGAIMHRNHDGPAAALVVATPPGQAWSGVPSTTRAAVQARWDGSIAIPSAGSSLIQCKAGGIERVRDG